VAISTNFGPTPLIRFIVVTDEVFSEATPAVAPMSMVA
jgi:hypothetical protein